MPVKAATLFFDPSGGEYQLGDTFLVDIKIDPEGECINSLEVHLKFSQDILMVKDFTIGGSILNLWLRKPEVNQEEGRISFIGGIPGGYCGRIPGDPDNSDVLGKIIFSIPETVVRKDIKEAYSAELTFDKATKVLLNDGLGSEANLVLKKASFIISSEKINLPKEEWLGELLKDRIPPEDFEIRIYRDPNIFEGKYFIIFQTSDKQTGIDHYEIKEGQKNWRRGESPYLLEDQKLRSIIRVKAIDKAGNERIAEYFPSKIIFWDLIPIIILFIFLITLLIIRMLIIKKFIRRNAQKTNSE